MEAAWAMGRALGDSLLHSFLFPPFPTFPFLPFSWLGVERKADDRAVGALGDRFDTGPIRVWMTANPWLCYVVMGTYFALIAGLRSAMAK